MRCADESRQVSAFSVSSPTCRPRGPPAFLDYRSKITRALDGGGHEGALEHSDNFYRCKGLQAQRVHLGNANVMQSTRGQQQKQRERDKEAMATDGRQIERIAPPAVATTTTTTTTVKRHAPSLVQCENSSSTSTVYTPVRRMSPPWTSDHREPSRETPPGEE